MNRQGESPCISVIVPYYNNQATIRETLHSVLQQTFTDWELILVDDGSRKEEADVLEALVQQDRRFRLVHQRNAGVSAARNKGIREAVGEWLFFLDADDLLSENAFSCLFSQADPAVDVVCGAYRIERRDQGDAQEIACADGDLQTVVDSLIRGDSALNSMCARLYRTALLRENRIQTPVGIAVGEDVLFNLEVFTAARAWRMLHDVVYTYRLGGDSAMIRANAEIYRASIPMLEGIGQFLQRQKWETKHFRAHIDIWLRTVRKDRGRLRAACAFWRASAAVTRGVDPKGLPTKQRVYYWALRICPPISIFLP